MHKLAFFIVTALFFSGCYETGKIEVQLSEGLQNIPLVPKGGLTTMCNLRIRGESNCNFTITIPSENLLHFEKGKINFEKNYEWFDKGKTIVINPDSCDLNSIITMHYRFSAGYFGT